MLAKYQSCHPWYPQIATLSFPEAALAILIATAFASPPERVNLTISAHGCNSINFSAKRIAACYAQLDDDKQNQFRYMLNKDAATFQSALDFAIRNV